MLEEDEQPHLEHVSRDHGCVHPWISSERVKGKPRTTC